MRYFVLFLVSFMPGICSVSTAQLCTLHGRVVDGDTGEPLEFVNVFLASTTSGTSSDTDGAFVLGNVPPGEYDIVVSRVGYHRVTRELSLEPSAILEFTFRLKHKDLQTEEMEVYSPNPAEWKRLFGLFTRVFLGQTENARDCTIRNPYQLDLRFDEGLSALTARCDSTLIVENRSLGYLVSIEIDQFEWDSKHERVQYSIHSRFRELEGTEDDVATWAGQREETYRGSLKHFLKCAVTGVLTEEMFALYAGASEQLSRGDGIYITSDGLHITPDPAPGVYRMSFGGWIRVDYRGNIPGTRNLLRLHAPFVRIDRDGNVLTRYGIETGGSWSRCGIADLLPMH
jgi:hypothetical protein